MLVVKKTFLKDFIKKHGDAVFEKLHDEKYLDIVGQFYRLTIDLRQLNSGRPPTSEHNKYPRPDAWLLPLHGLQHQGHFLVLHSR